MKRTTSTLLASAILVGMGGAVFHSFSATSGPFGGSDSATTCGEGLSCSSEDYTATATSGSGFTCNSALTTCLDLGPGSDNGIGTNGSGHVVLGSGDGTSTVCFGELCSVSISENQNVSVSNGAVILNNGTTIYNQTAGKAIPMDAAFGVQITAKTLGTCASAAEGSVVRDAAAGGTTGAQTRLCLCVSDGAATPAYTWTNLGCPNTAGTDSTCPACP